MRADQPQPRQVVEKPAESGNGATTPHLDRAIQATTFKPPEFLVPRSFEEVERLAEKICAAGWVPKSYIDRATNKPNQARVEVAIMHGMEIGMRPMAALQSIAVINGQPALWGDGMLAVVEASGLLEVKEEHVERQADDGLTAICRVKRRGKPKVIERKFSLAMAKHAGLMGKDGPWQSYPGRMLQMRARAWALRDEFSDILKGFRSAEELYDAADVVDLYESAAPAPPRPSQSDYLPPADKQSDRMDVMMVTFESNVVATYTLPDEAETYTEAFCGELTEAGLAGHEQADDWWERNSHGVGNLVTVGRNDLAEKCRQAWADLCRQWAEKQPAAEEPPPSDWAARADELIAEVKTIRTMADLRQWQEAHEGELSHMPEADRKRVGLAQSHAAVALGQGAPKPGGAGKGSSGKLI